VMAVVTKDFQIVGLRRKKIKKIHLKIR